MKARREKLEAFQAAGVNPYPYSFDRTHSVETLLEDFDSLLENGTEVFLGGRLVAKRVMGKASFAHILDESGRIQIYVRRDDINTEDNPESYSLFKTRTDLGDWIGIRGVAMVTKTGEKSIHVNEWTILAKSLRPLPVVKEDADTGKRFHEFTDPDERYRNRALDLIVNPDEREVFRTRNTVISIMRKVLEEHKFLEVETPVLQPLYGGGTARPFTTHHHQLKKDLFLRIADELYLKRLIVGGLDRVYEISKDFRNEGVDRTHNPEFTMMECYQAFADYNVMMELVEEIVSRTAMELHSSNTVTYNSDSLDFTVPWQRVKFFDALEKVSGENLIGADLEKLKGIAKANKIELEEKTTLGKVLDTLFSELVEPTFTRPTFVIDYPLEISPLAKRHRDDDRLVERFEAFVAGMEIANAFSELNDPDDQRFRFEMQAQAKAEGDDEAMQLDEDYLAVMELGMPPTAGLGMGVDRLAMIMSDRQSIRDVILFPLLRDKEETEQDEE